jgi:large subunit ribosomal protein L4
MATAKVYTMDGRELGPIELNNVVFDAEMNHTLVHDVAVALRNAKRQGNAETKVRSEVSGGGRKPYRQKGTGNARHGSTREPEMRGGGTVFGPHKRSYRQAVPVRSKRKALCCVLSDRVRGESLCVLDALKFEVPKTKPFVEMLDLIAPDGRKTLFVTAGVEKNVMLSSRNIPKVNVCTAADLNALDVLEAVRVVVVRDALPKLEERLTHEK